MIAALLVARLRGAGELSHERVVDRVVGLVSGGCGRVVVSDTLFMRCCGRDTRRIVPRITMIAELVAARLRDAGELCHRSTEISLFRQPTVALVA